MHSNKIYIIGWSGFIGRQYIHYLDKTGFKGEVFLNSRADDEQKYTSSTDNITIKYVNYEEMITGLNCSRSTVLYLANMYSPGESNIYPLNSVKENIIPFITFLEDIKNNASNIRFIFASSGGTIYGDSQEGECCSENHLLAPKTIYAANKIAQENYLNVYHVNYGLDYRIARIANPYGPGQILKGGQGLIPAILRSLLNNESLPVSGDGNGTRDYIYIDDLCSLFFSLSSYSGACRTFNAGSGKEYSIMEIISCFNAVHDRPIKYHHVKTESSVVSRIVLDISRAKNELGWSPKTSLSDGIRAFINWSIQVM
ncbi:NAD-dependent epimerase/dehydratase family protein [Escherichia coli]